MKRSDELKQAIEGLNDKLIALDNLAGERSLSEEQQTEWDSIESEINIKKKDLERALKAEAIQDQKAAQEAQQRASRAKDKGQGGEKKEKRNAMKEYSFIRAINSMLPNGKPLDGIEREMHQEAEKEAQRTGKSLSGVGVPSFFVDIDQKRDLVVGTNTAGGHTVATDLDGFIAPLRPRLQVANLGATILSGLTSNVDIPRQTSTTSATWEGEQDTNEESNPAFDKISLTPKRLGAKTHISKQLLVQSSLGIENLVRNDLSIAIQTALDSAAINGSGTAPTPEGILNVTGIGSVAIGTNGGAPTRAHLIDLWKEIAIDNADQGALAFLTTPGVKAKLMNTLLDSGSGRFVWEQMESLVGYRALTSTQVPSNLTKGTGTNLHAIIFGYWSDLLIGQWNGVDLVVDPYTLADTASVRLVINSWWDLAVRHAESFAAITDADIS